MNLLLITTNYPYGKGEQFLSEEIDFLSKKVDIVVYPSSCQGIARKLPSNVKLIECRHRYTWRNFFIGFFTAILKFSPMLFSDVVKTVKSEKIRFFKISRLAYIAVYIARAYKFIVWFESQKHKNNLDERLIYTYWMNSESYAVSLLKRHNPRLKTISRVHGGDLYKDRNDGFLPFRTFIVESLDRIFPISNHGKEYLINEYGNNMKGKISVSRLGVVKSDQVEYGINDNITITSCSSNDPVKRISLILRAVGEFSTRSKKCVIWAHIGIENDVFNKKYRQIARQYDNLKCDMVGIVPNKNVTAVYREYKPDIFINLSKSEGVPVSIMEALSCGIPVVATDVGGTSEIVDNATGILVCKDSSVGLIADAIDTVVGNRDEHAKVAFNRWKNICDSDKNYDAYYKVLKRL